MQLLINPLEVTVDTSITPRKPGRVKLQGIYYNAEVIDESSLHPGQRVFVTAIRDNIALVTSRPTPIPVGEINQQSIINFYKIKDASESAEIIKVSGEIDATLAKTKAHQLISKQLRNDTRNALSELGKSVSAL
ncbi:MAG: hypothetical protein AAFQ63_21910 [Cyanobacteria bacterium J06621_11]